MALTSLDVRRIAELARLEIGADEEARMLEQLNAIFRIVEQLSAVDTSGVEPIHAARASRSAPAPARRRGQRSRDRERYQQRAPAARTGSTSCRR